jgi:hypothetical protein
MVQTHRSRPNQSDRQTDRNCSQCQSKQSNTSCRGDQSGVNVCQHVGVFDCTNCSNRMTTEAMTNKYMPSLYLPMPPYIIQEWFVLHQGSIPNIFLVALTSQLAKNGMLKTKQNMTHVYPWLMQLKLPPFKSVIRVPNRQTSHVWYGLLLCHCSLTVLYV